MEIVDTTVDSSIDMERIVTSMRGKLNSLSHLSTKSCIYEVPKKLRKINEDAYTPVRLSIGPLHHGKKDLQPMEEHKWKYLEDFLERQSEESLEGLIKFVEEKEERIRKCYAEIISFEREKFVEIILVDAAFIIEVLLRYSHFDLITPNDGIFGKPWLINDIYCDLILLENQLPFFILQDLFEMANIKVGFDQDETPTFIELTRAFFEGFSQLLDIRKNMDSFKVHHFLDFLRKSVITRDMLLQENKITISEFEFIPCATKLREAGVKFKVGSSKNLFDIKLRGNVLEIPRIKIDDMTECLLRNLLAFEQCHHKTRFLTDYAMLMDCLINTSKDVELLVQSGVIENWLGDNKDVSNLFNKLNKEGTFNTQFFHFSELYKELNDHCKIRMHKWKATLRHDYCNTPWRVLSIAVAIILLVLTLVQTICSIIAFPFNK